MLTGHIGYVKLNVNYILYLSSESERDTMYHLTAFSTITSQGDRDATAPTTKYPAVARNLGSESLITCYTRTPLGFINFSKIFKIMLLFRSDLI